MEQIEIKDFLTIEHAVFEIKKINILIGEQAQGKSVIAKLVYFFRSLLENLAALSVDFEGDDEIKMHIRNQFEECFPSYSWSNQNFSVEYQHKQYKISIARNGNELTPLAVEYDKLFLSLVSSKLIGEFAKLIQTNVEKETKESSQLTDKILGGLILAVLNNSKDKLRIKPVEPQIFIPAGRSFFAVVQENVFSMLVGNSNLDHFMEEFGSHYEKSKREYSKGSSSLKRVIRYEDNNLTLEKSKSEVTKLASEILLGNYVSSEGLDWIEYQGRKTKLTNASSGQQESLPMLLILRTLPFSYAKNILATFFIEEPEAHLFPNAQKKIVSLIATIYKELGHSFFITTHSPYILTAINNLVVGQDAYDKVKDNPEKLAALEKVLPASQLIRLEDVSAYTLKNGKLESIIDWENRLIGANLLDAVSDEFEQAFNVASDMLYGD